MHRFLRRLGSLGACSGAIASLAQCGGSDLMLPGSPDPGAHPAAIAVVKGDAQSGTPGSVLRDSIVVEVTDSAEAPLEGQQVEFAPDAPGAAVTPQTVTTGIDGMAGARWVLGETIGPQEVVARVVGPPTSDTLRVSFTASAEAVVPAPSRLEVRREPSASATIGLEFERQPEVQIRDEKGKDIKSSGVRVTAAVASGTGSLGGVTTRLTDSRGRAEFRDLRIDAGTGAHVLIFAANGYTSTTSRAIDVQPPVNQAPAVINDDYNTTEGHDRTLAVGAAAGVLLNDRDPEGGVLTVSVAGAPANGTVTLNGDGSFSYNPVVNFFGDDSFTYRATDPEGNASIGTVTIHVAPVNDAPGFTVNTNPVVAPRDIPQTVSNFAIGISPGADNESNQILTFEVIGNSAPWLFAAGPTITRDGQSGTATLTFSPAPGQAGAAAVTIQLRDNGGVEFGGFDTSAPQTFTIVIP